jgi:hypothetical protein
LCVWCVSESDSSKGGFRYLVPGAPSMLLTMPALRPFH